MSSEERVITDPKWIRAMAHPLRWQILDVLRANDSPMTATQVSEVVGESPANTSFHLRILAKYGFIEEAGGGKGRSRPWRPRDISIEVIDDPESASMDGAKELRDIIRARAFKTIEAWEHHDTYDYSPAWRRSAMEVEWDVPLTIDDLVELQADLKELVARYTRRDPAPKGAIAAKIYGWAFPIGDPKKPKSGSKRPDRDKPGHTTIHPKASRRRTPGR